MKIFITGATGYVGTELTKKLIKEGHKVIGLTRRESGAEKLSKLGAEGIIGELTDYNLLKKYSKQCDGVIHLAFNFEDFSRSLEVDLKAIQTIGKSLENTNKVFISTAHANGSASDNAMLELCNKGVRSSVISLAPSVHDIDDKGFIPQLINIAREKGFSAYIDNGENRWTAIHRLDAINLYKLTLEKAPSGYIIDGVADENIKFKDIANLIGKKLNLPVISIPSSQAQKHFGFLAFVVSADLSRSNAKTKELLGWKPIQLDLLSNMKTENYFK